MFVFSGTRSIKRKFEAANFDFDAELPRIRIERNVHLDCILLKRKRIIQRRMTAADDIIIEPVDAVSVTLNVHDRQLTGRMIFAVGSTNKTFRSINNRRKSVPPVQSKPDDLFDANISKNDEDNGFIRISFTDVNFGRLDD